MWAHARSLSDGHRCLRLVELPNLLDVVPCWIGHPAWKGASLGQVARPLLILQTTPAILRAWQSSGLTSYSRRLSWATAPNRIAELTAEKRRLGVSLIDLTASNPTEAIGNYPHDLIGQAYGSLRDFTYRPDPLGSKKARQAIAAYYQQRAIKVSPERLVVTASTSEAYTLLFKLLCDPGDEVLVPIPSYPLFEYLAAMECVGIAPYRLLYDGSWFIDFEHLREQISTRSKAIVIVNPNNPTGSFLKVQELTELIALAQECSLPIISDEVFMDYPLEVSSDRVGTLIGTPYSLSFSLNGLSKAAGMPQMKLGWIAINGPDRDSQLARDRLELLTDNLLSVATPVQEVLPELLHIGSDIRKKLAEQIAKNFDRLLTSLGETPAHALFTEGGWSAILQVPRTQPEEAFVMKLLQDQNVLVQPGYFFDMPSEAYVVVSLIALPDKFAEGIERLKLLVTQH